jgi:type II secretory pathway component PulJ
VFGFILLAVMLSIAVLALVSLRAAMYTVAPALERIRESSCPIPEVLPVMMTALSG